MAASFTLISLIAYIASTVMSGVDRSKIAEVILGVYGLGFLLEAILCNFQLKKRGSNYTDLIIIPLIMLNLVGILGTMIANSVTGCIFTISSIAVLSVMYVYRWRYYYHHL